MAKDALSVGMIDGIIAFDELVNSELTAIANESSLANSRAYVRKNLALLD
jgi:hypothetical protein